MTPQFIDVRYSRISEYVASKFASVLSGCPLVLLVATGIHECQDRFLMKKLLLMLGLSIARCLRWTLDTIPRLLLDFWHRNDTRRIPPINDPILLESVTDLADYIRRGKLKSVDVLKAYISRIEELQPYLNAVIDERFQSALSEAQAVDEMVSSGQMSQEEMAAQMPLLGIPFTAKDSFAITGMLYTAGLLARKGIRAQSDAEAVQLFKKAGAIPIALTNVPELILWYDSNNKLYGRTNNPYNLTRIPGGSSGGEGSLIAGAGSVLGLGSDIGGSIRIPAFYCGVYGHKPTPGVVLSEGQYPPIFNDDLREMLGIGPICRYSKDLRLALKVLAGDRAPLLNLDQRVDLKKLRIYYMDDDGGSPLATPVHPDVRKGMRKVLLHFEERYGISAKRVNLSKLQNSFVIWGCRICVDSGDQTLAQEMTNRNGEANAPLELVKKIFGLSRHTLPVIMVALLEMLSKKFRKTQMCVHILKLCSDLRQEFLQLLEDDAVFVYPGNPEPAIYHHETLLKSLVVGYTGVFNALGLPVTQIPTGLSSEGLPVGVQVVCGPYQDRLGLAVAEELEASIGGWISPSKTPAEKWVPQCQQTNSIST